ncbi:IclR family transcriptional regulator [Poseidonocella sedimentorum]|uniref:DNA-binding transcriptional regulator, IclR family n=1 Tax=Poseidonocella sedimentorum TaxID=871652 RepID=A0A1I6D6B1_9RHOB|nr:IclR family transcriptional regulator [Poseidonocella sedimentorum]SFR00998.1 DNA-binding transcriptional regulator, IclR family [Poseidonocella sedimentorum]
MAQSPQGDGTVAKALAVLDMVSEFGRPVRFGELLERANYPKATLYRLVQTLTRQGMLSHDAETQTYALGMRLVRMAHSAWQQSSLAPIARPFIDALSRDLGETVHLAQIDNAQVLYVDKRNATRPVAMFSDAGKVGPAYCTGVGKAMLAFLDEAAREHALDQQSYHAFTPHTLASREALEAELENIRERGFAYDREEHEPGIICVAVPILTRNRRVLGSLSITTTTSRATLDDLATRVPRIVDAARDIARAASDWRFPETAGLTELVAE